MHPEPGQANYIVNETETVTFECSATGISAPTITWTGNGIEPRDNRTTISNPILMDYMRTTDNETVWKVTRTLAVANTVETDSGIYTCHATNNVGFDENTFALAVQSKLHAHMR